MSSPSPVYTLSDTIHRGAMFGEYPPSRRDPIR